MFTTRSRKSNALSQKPNTSPVPKPTPNKAGLEQRVSCGFAILEKPESFGGHSLIVFNYPLETLFHKVNQAQSDRDPV